MERKIAKILMEMNCLQFATEEPFVYASGATGPHLL